MIIDGQTVSRLYLGTNEVSKIYIGAEQAYPATENIFVFADNAMSEEELSTALGITINNYHLEANTVTFSNTNYIIPTEAFRLNTNLISVYSSAIEVGTELSGQCFYGCTALESISFPLATVIYEGAFSYCSSLTTISIPLITDIQGGCFDGCNSLLSINLPAVTQIGEGAFLDCTSLVSVSLPSASVIGYDIVGDGYQFGNCTALTTVNLPVATEIGSTTFYNCTSLTSISLPSAITLGDSVFSSCLFLESVSLPQVTSIGTGVFEQCGAIQSISLLALETAPESAFNSLPVLTELLLPSLITVGSSNFNYLDAITSIYLPLVETVGDTCFQQCTLLSSASLSSALSFGNDNFYECPALQSVSLPLVETMGDGAFTNCGTLEHLVLPVLTFNSMLQSSDAIVSISFPRITSFDGLPFDYNSKYLLESLSMDSLIAFTDNIYGSPLKHLSFASLITMGDGAFYANASLLTINAPLVETIGAGAFIDCVSLASVSFPLATAIGDYAFIGCTLLNEVTLPSVVMIGRSVFSNDTSITSISLPSATTIGEQSFVFCTGLISVDLPLVETIGDYCFQNCTALESISLPMATTLGAQVFSYCNLLESVSLPVVTTMGVNDLGYQGTFVDCTALTSVSLPVINTINSFTFSGCTSLVTASLPEAITIYDSAFSGCTSLGYLSILKCETLGSTVDDDGVFSDIAGNSISLIVPSSLMTCNVGGPDGDIAYLRANNNVGIGVEGTQNMVVFQPGYVMNEQQLSFALGIPLLGFNISGDDDNVITFINYDYIAGVGNSFANPAKRLIYANLACTGTNTGLFNSAVYIENCYLPLATQIAQTTFATNKVLKNVYLPKVTSMGSYNFNYGTDEDMLESLYMPLCEDLGGTVGNDNVFRHPFGVYSSSIALTIPITLMTCNGGSPDGDIQYLQTKATVDIIMYPNGFTFTDGNALTEEQLSTALGMVISDYVLIDDTVTFSNTGYIISASAFASNLDLVRVYSSAIEVGSASFYGCTALESISFPLTTVLHENAFDSCNLLTTVSVQLATTIGTGSFSNCSTLTSVSLPSAITIGDNAFSGSVALSNIYIPVCENLGSTVGDNNVFGNISGSIVAISVPTALMICNGGDPDGDIQYLQANNSVTASTSVEIIVSGDGGIHDDNVESAFRDGYLLGGSAFTDTLQLRVESLYSSFIYAGTHSTKMIIRSYPGLSDGIRLQPFYYPIQLVMPAGSNSHIQVYNSQGELPAVIVAGAGDAANETGYDIEFYSNDPITPEPEDLSSYSSGYIAGMIYYVAKHTNNNIWTARYLLRQALGDSWTGENGYGKLTATTIADAIALYDDQVDYSALDPYN